MLWATLETPAKISAVAAALAAVAAFALAAVVYRARRGDPLNARAAGILLLEGAFVGSLSVMTLFGLHSDLAANLVLSAVLIADGAFMLLFIGRLQPRWARAFATTAGRAAVAVASLAAFALVAYQGWSRRAVLEVSDPAFAAAWVIIGGAALVALAATVQDFRLTPAGSAAHRRATAFALAFGTRNAFVGVGIVAWAVSDALNLLALRAWTEVAGVIGPLLLSVLLAYGILSTQLFDIDLKVKFGIKSGTLAAIFVGGFFAVYKVVEFYLGREFGYAFGGVLSGVFFFLAPRLNKFADGVANKAMPQAQPTPEYLAFKKLEVYKAAVETALEDGTIDERDRSMLDSLRRRLGLKPADADAVEAELVPPAPRATATA